jgi:DNA-directed RNA polymerase subunit H (RpoH/RPB5)
MALTLGQVQRDASIMSLQHVVIESRRTILELLELRGYDSTPYQKFLGPDLLKLVHTNPIGLRMTLQHKTKPGQEAIIEYDFRNIKNDISKGAYVSKMLESDPSTPLSGVNPETTEVIILYMSRAHNEDNEAYDKGALQAWMKHKLKIQFFHIPRLVSNPLKHVLQPKFEIVPTDEHMALLKDHYAFNVNQTMAQNKMKFPCIKFHNDMAARCLGLLPLDIVKITAPSQTAGEYVKYRVCVP